jgi:hypothetical protein
MTLKERACGIVLHMNSNQILWPTQWLAGLKLHQYTIKEECYAGSKTRNIRAHKQCSPDKRLKAFMVAY